MSYSITGTPVIEANGKVQWSKIVNVTAAVTVNTTMQTTGSGTELANGCYLAISGSDLRAYRTLGNCNCNCDCLCSGGGD
jgi:hypothetical protein